MKRIENVVLLKVIGVFELLAAIALFYFYHDEIPAVMAAVFLLGFSANSFYQAHKHYKNQYSPKKTEQ